jgi:hypothetical protein
VSSDQGIEAWRRAAEELGIEVIAPFTFTVDSRTHECTAWVGQFGNARGTLVVVVEPPSFALDRQLIADAEREGYKWSALSTALYNRFDRALFIETLSDWQYVGPAALRPDWLARQS